MGLRTLRNSADLVVVEPGRPRQGDMLAPLVRGPAVPSRPEDDELPVSRRQPATIEQLAAERQPAAKEARVPGQGAEYVERGTLAEPGQQLALLVGRLV